MTKFVFLPDKEICLKICNYKTDLFFVFFSKEMANFFLWLESYFQDDSEFNVDPFWRVGRSGCYKVYWTTQGCFKEDDRALSQSVQL